MVGIRRRYVALAGFTPAALADQRTLELAERISIVPDDKSPDDKPDVNALTPVEVSIELNSGFELKRTVHTRLWQSGKTHDPPRLPGQIQ
ncbi:MAG: hypothetical protein GKR94_14530 [Gammaproteobacteria bacterium]|nr:hypothetical protein [Gammaproteobacteria bacterium]